MRISSMFLKTTAFGLLLLSATSPVAYAAADAPAVTIQKRAGFPNFADLVEPLLQAVVNISTTSEAGNRGRVMMDLPFPPGSPFEELFRQYLDNEGMGGDMGMGGPAQKAPKVQSLGSGFLIAQEGNTAYVVTANHVVADADEINVSLNDEAATKLKAEIVGRDRRTDVALLKVTTDKKLTTVNWADSSKTRPGEWLIAIGNPFGFTSTVTLGIVSTIARDVAAKTRMPGVGDYVDGYIQTDASINLGNSGGPMFNDRGEVIGITTAIISPNGGNVGIGFGVPSNTASAVVEQLKKFGRTKRGWLGVTVQNVAEGAGQPLGLEKEAGAIVTIINPTSPAAKAGVKRGDVLLTFNGKEIKRSQNLPRIVGEAPIGTKVPIELMRSGKKMTLDVEVGEFETAEDEGLIAGLQSDQMASAVDENMKPTLGLLTQEIKPAQVERLGLTEDTKGILVVGVKATSDAAEKGMRPGVIISEVISDSKSERLAKPADFETVIAKARKAGRKQVVLVVVDQNLIRYLPLDLKEEDVPEAPTKKSAKDAAKEAVKAIVKMEPQTDTTKKK